MSVFEGSHGYERSVILRSFAGILQEDWMSRLIKVIGTSPEGIFHFRGNPDLVKLAGILRQEIQRGVRYREIKDLSEENDSLQTIGVSTFGNWRKRKRTDTHKWVLLDWRVLLAEYPRLLNLQLPSLFATAWSMSEAIYRNAPGLHDLLKTDAKCQYSARCLGSGGRLEGLTQTEADILGKKLGKMLEGFPLHRALKKTFDHNWKAVTGAPKGLATALKAKGISRDYVSVIDLDKIKRHKALLPKTIELQGIENHRLFGPAQMKDELLELVVAAELLDKELGIFFHTESGRYYLVIDFNKYARYRQTKTGFYDRLVASGKRRLPFEEMALPPCCIKS